MPDKPDVTMTYTSPIGEMDYVMTHIEYPNQGAKAQYAKVTRPRFDSVLSTFFHFKDRRYNSCLHKIMISFIREWGRAVIKLSNKLDIMKFFSNHERYRNQRIYTETMPY